MKSNPNTFVSLKTSHKSVKHETYIVCRNVNICLFWCNFFMELLRLDERMFWSSDSGSVCLWSSCLSISSVPGVCTQPAFDLWPEAGRRVWFCWWGFTLRHTHANVHTHTVTDVCAAGLCVAGAALSSYFRCSVLLVFPSMLGSRGRTYLTILVLSVLFKGKETKAPAGKHLEGKNRSFLSAAFQI